MPTVRVRFEQAVYGSFPFWDRGYALLAHSPGCRPEWLAEFLAACQHYGEPRGGPPETCSLFSLRLTSGPWIVVGVSPQGHDDQGRPGALAFHALFLSPREYRKAGHIPFGLSGALRRDWTAETRTLPPGAWPVEVPGTPEPPRRSPSPPGSRRSSRAAGAWPSKRPGRSTPWRGRSGSRLPDRVRRRASVATWAFGNGNRFDLVALPRLAGVELDSSYVDPPYPLPPGEGGRRPGEGPRPREGPARDLHRGSPPGAGDVPCPPSRPGRSWPASCSASPCVPRTATTPGPHRRLDGAGAQPPAPSRGDEAPTTPEERRRVAEALRDMAERFEVISADAAARTPTRPR